MSSGYRLILKMVGESEATSIRYIHNYRSLRSCYRGYLLSSVTSMQDPFDKDSATLISNPLIYPVGFVLFRGERLLITVVDRQTIWEYIIACRRDLFQRYKSRN